MNEKEIVDLFKKMGINVEKTFNDYKDNDEEGLYKYGRPLGKGERIIVKTF